VFKKQIIYTAATYVKITAHLWQDH